MGTICSGTSQMVPIEISQTPPPLSEDSLLPLFRGGEEDRFR